MSIMGSFFYISSFLLMLHILLSLFHLIVIGSSSPLKQPLCHDDEKSALLQFKASFSIYKYASSDPSAYPKSASWKPAESSDCCSWDGVACDANTGHVIRLDLSSSFLYGSINSSSSLFQLTHLRKLNLANNHFNYSQIPSEIRYLSRLTYLNLSISAFSGQIPLEISELSKLTSLDLSLNVHNDRSLLKLEKPSLNNLLQNLTSLKELLLNKVNISTVVPGILANLSSLTSLFLGDCKLQGEFPAAIFQLPNLQSLCVRNNPYLTGHLPEFNESSPLMLLRLASTNFFGKLPYSIGNNLNSLNHLDIKHCNFSGPIPFSLGNLTQLEYLDLSYNSFSPRSLDWLGEQTKFVHMSLAGTHLNGYIPYSLRNMTRLSFLRFSRNNLIGQIPPWFGNLTQLTTLALSDNQLHGPIPQTIYKLVNIEHLNIGKNHLNGTVELDKILNLKNLTYIDLSYNQFSLLMSSTGVNATLPRFEFVALASCNLSEFPDFLRHQYKLQRLDLSSNNIQGIVPNWMFNIGKDTLTGLLLKNNFLTGIFGQTSVVLPWTRLRVLDLAHNKLEESLPIPQPSIIHYWAANNSLTGELSPSICNLSFLFALDLSFNNLSGTIPQCLGNFSSFLRILRLQNNNFHGFIPQTYIKGSRLRGVDLSHNQLQGLVPRSLVGCKMLEMLDLGNNQLDDIFPSWLGTLTNLRVLLLQSNRFHGIIGNLQTKFDFPKLRIIDLSYNNFSGKLPSEYIEAWSAMKSYNVQDLRYMGADISYRTPSTSISYTEYSYSITITSKRIQQIYAKIPEIFRAIDLSSNKFEGEIPTSFGTLEGLQLLNLSNNILTGRIPSFLGNLRELESLGLSRNNFSGEIPQQLAELTFLAVLDVSYNNLTGPIPQGGQFDTFPNNSFEGNLGLCGSTLSKKCENLEAPVPPQTSSSDEEEDFKFPSGYDWIFIVAGYGSGLVVGLIFGHIWTTRKQEWFIETFGRRPQMRQMGRQRRRRN